VEGSSSASQKSRKQRGKKQQKCNLIWESFQDLLYIIAEDFWYKRNVYIELF
jgi:hypothetical protein